MLECQRMILKQANKVSLSQYTNFHIKREQVLMSFECNFALLILFVAYMFFEKTCVFLIRESQCDASKD